jgi:cyclophilin family peptidyl-prolyl cis-trans isomerase
MGLCQTGPMKNLVLIPLLLAAAPVPAPPPAPSPGEIVAAAPASDWVAIAPSDLLVMDLAPDAKGKPRRVVIQLMPPPFSQGWISNIRKLATAHWWDGTSVNRVQDNYVVQWGDATEKKALPPGLVTVSEWDYSYQPKQVMVGTRTAKVDFPVDGSLPISYLNRDSYAYQTSFSAGWPLSINLNYLPVPSKIDPKNEASYFISRLLAPTHCYAMVGVGRNLSPDTGTGAELYTVIGHAPRHLDRNIALVGRVIEGIEHLSSLPRGTEALGFYKTPEERVPIVSTRLAPDLPSDKPFPRYQYLSTESGSFAKYADARANRRDPFFIKPAGGADICNIPVPVRRAP